MPGVGLTSGYVLIDPLHLHPTSPDPDMRFSDLLM